MKLTVSLVYGSADAPQARQLGSYLEHNAALDLEYDEVDGDLLDVVGRALSSDVLVLMLSPHSVPRRLERDEWEPVFVEASEENGTNLAFVPLADCPFPKVLLRSHVFAPQPDLLSCSRRIKRWLLELKPPFNRGYFVRPGESAPLSGEEMERLWREFADRPAAGVLGDTGAARAFASAVQADFDSVFWVDCRSCTPAEVAGELGIQLGLRLPGDLRSNLEAVRGVYRQYRCLIVLEGASEEVAAEFPQEGLSSILLIRPAEPVPPMSFEQATANRHALAGWAVRPTAVPASGEIRRTLTWLIDADWNLAREFARAAVACYRFQERFAEAFEWVEMLVYEAVERLDPITAGEFGRERAWILEGWGVDVARSRSIGREPPPEQLALF